VRLERWLGKRECGEPKAIGHLEPLDFRPPAVDAFKSLQWTCWRIGEETPWYVENYLKTPRDELPKEQWTRLGLDRELLPPKAAADALHVAAAPSPE